MIIATILKIIYLASVNITGCFQKLRILPVLPDRDNACVGMMRDLPSSVIIAATVFPHFIRMNIFNWIEYISSACGLAYVILIMRQNIWCWLFGILSSALYILSCFHAKLYLEGGLNFYYVAVGLYGWVLWIRRNKRSEEALTVTEKQLFFHAVNIGVCVLLTVFLGKIMQRYTDSPRPFFDAALTVFSFSASILEARKILSAWIYWTIINGASVVLMIDRGMYVYAALSVVMTLLSVKGYFDWRKSKRQTQSLRHAEFISASLRNTESSSYNA